MLARERVGTIEGRVGVVVSADATRAYLLTSAAHALVALDAVTLREVGRVQVGRRRGDVVVIPCNAN